MLTMSSWLVSICLSVLCVSLVSSSLVRSIFAQNDMTKQIRPDLVKHRDCHSRWMSGEREPGMYNIYPNGSHPVQMYCGHSANNTYTVIQRRYDGSQSFKRGWYDYKYGFGHAQGDYWAGLDMIHYLTSTGNTIMRMDMQDWNGNSRYVQYSHFSIGPETDRYRLAISGATGTLVYDDMAFSNGMQFGTLDFPDVRGCASAMHAGWWYNYCAYTLPNGYHYAGGSYPTPSTGWVDGIFYKDWLGYNYSLKFFTITLYKR